MRRGSRTGGLWTGALLVALALGSPGCDPKRLGAEAPAGADPAAERAARIEAGHELFRAFCGSCHGAQARGDGPAAAALHTPPADLTRIAQRRGGRFEGGEIAAYIDGRTEIIAHGDRDMPIWGRIYDDRNAALLTDETRLSPGMIFNIVEYLRSIQGT